ncbi:MAG: heme o synthase, partial [Phycisphaerae bacterium]
MELSKARLCALVLLTTFVGFLLGSQAGIDWRLAISALLGTAFSAFGINAVNQCMEADRDARMIRTRGRPLPAGLISRRAGWMFGISLAAAGALLLALTVNLLTAALALACQLIYVLIYTPLKVRSSLNTLVGAICGAIPPMMGWTAATGRLDAGAWVLGAILFVWQVPHFLSLAWMYREDYARGGFRMLPTFDGTGQATCQAVLLYSLVLIPVTLMLTVVGITGWVYAAGALVLGGLLSALGLRLYRERGVGSARRVFLASVVYLPLLLGLMVTDRASSRDVAALRRPVASAHWEVAAAVVPDAVSTLRVSRFIVTADVPVGRRAAG